MSVTRANEERREASRASFAARLRQLRTDAGLSQKQLEHRSGVPKSRISRYENGHLLPSMVGLKRLASSLGVADSALLGESEAPYATFVRALRERGITFASAEQAERTANEIAEVFASKKPASRRSAHRRSG